MTEVATPPPATERACPRCGASLAADQEWCLSCGTGVGTRIAPTPRWRMPVVLVGTLLALLAAALVLSLVELGGDPQPVAQAPANAATPTPSAAPDDGAATPAPTVAPEPTAAPGATSEPGLTPPPGEPTPEGGGTTKPGQPTPEGSGTTKPGEPTPDGGGSTATGGLAQWPEGKRAWTVVIASTRSRAEAETKARAAGGDAGVLRSADYSSLRKGYWVVFAGQYTSRSAAQTAAEGRDGGAYARRVVPR